MLVRLLYRPNFKDSKAFGLYNSLSHALKNIAESNYRKVTDALGALVNETPDHKDLLFFCNNLLEDLSYQHNNRMDIPWDFKELENFLSKTP